MHKSKSLLIFMIFTAVICLAACSLDTAKTAAITINTGLGSKASMTKAMAPLEIESITLSITGPGMSPIEATFVIEPPILSRGSKSSGGDEPVYDYYNGIISVIVPVGNSRTFNVTASVNPYSNSAALAYTGSKTSDIVGGDNNITIQMAMSETKIVIPDYYNNRVLQIDDMADATPNVLSGDAVAGFSELDHISAASEFSPYDIDIDNSGRIYIANYYGIDTSGFPVILRIDNISSAMYDVIVTVDETDSFSGIKAIDIDRNNNYIYYCDNMDKLYRKTIEPLGTLEPVAFNFDATYIYGIAVDNNGNVYLAVQNTYNGIIKFAFNDPPASSSDTEKYTYYETLAGTFWDVIVKNNYVYAASNFANSVGNKDDRIIQLTPDLTFQDELLQNPADADKFNGPHRFVAVLNSRFYLIDDDESGSDTDRIVAFDNISGDGWTTYNNESSPFNFFSNC